MALLDQRDPKNNDLFKNLQGNVLKGHGREHTANIFIKCDAGKAAEVKKWIKSLWDRGLITSTKKQLRDIFLWKDACVDGGVFGTILFSAKGYEYLGFNTANNFSSEFLNGMKNAGLNDPPIPKWERGFRGDIHFLLLIGDNNKKTVKTLADKFKKEINKFGSVTTTEFGDALKNAEKAGIEHFGYVDGVSQPLFFEDEIERYKGENNIKNNVFQYNPSAEKELVLVADPFNGEQDAFGSYFVFRKLEENVRGFKAAEEKLGETDLKLIGEDVERAGAMIVGRFEDGTPVELSDEAEMIKSYVINDFDYKKDDASKCPFHGHIRKANPRSASPFEDIKGVQAHVMARRGITFGERDDGPNDGIIDNKPKGGVGLLFMSYQASLENQFGFIQRVWANNKEFPFKSDGNTNKDSGIDPIIGQDGADNISTGEFASKWGDNTKSNFKTASFDDFVKMKGGEYFFSPSISFLEALA